MWDSEGTLARQGRKEAMVYLMTMGWFWAHASLAMAPEQYARSRKKSFFLKVCKSKTLIETTRKFHPCDTLRACILAAKRQTERIYLVHSASNGL